MNMEDLDKVRAHHYRIPLSTYESILVMQQLHVSTLGNKWYLYLNSLCFEMYITKLRYLVTSCSFLCFCLDVISDLRLSIQK